MIIIRTPYRISLFGGGTDYPKWYNKHKGSVISTSINKYSYIVLRELPNLFKYNYRLRYFKREQVNLINDIKHPVVREAIKLLNIKGNLDITHHGDLPARSGMGSSSSFSVGLLHAFIKFNDKNISKKKLAELAINLEQNILKEPVGSQDQVIASYGGFNRIDFGRNNKNFICNKINLSTKKLKTLEGNMQLFFTNKTRDSSSVSSNKIKNISSNKKILFKMIDIVNEAEFILRGKDKNYIYKIGNLMNQQWNLKKELASNVSNKHIDKIYNKAISNGAYGGKILGAGGGGFLMFITPLKFQKKVKESLNLTEVRFNFDYKGSELIYKIEDYINEQDLKKKINV